MRRDERFRKIRMKEGEMRKLMAILLVVAIASVALVFGCAGEEKKEIRVGAVLPLTGPVASIGKSAQNGLQMATEDVNSEGGVLGCTLRIFFEDGMADPKTSLSGFRKLIDVEKVKFVITTLSNVSMALIPSADQNKILLFADAAHPEITGKSTFVFRHSNTTDYEAEVIVKHIAAYQSIRRLGIIAVNNDYGRSYIEQLKILAEKTEADFALVGEEYFDLNERDFRSILTRLLKHSPDCIVVAGAGASMGTAIKQLKELGYKGVMYTSLPFTLTPEGIRAAGDAINGVFYLAFAFEDAPEVLSFKVRFKERFGFEPEMNAVIEYSTLQLLVYAMRESGSSDPVTVKDYLRELRSFQALSGEMMISPNGDINSPVVVKQFRNSEN